MRESERLRDGERREGEIYKVLKDISINCNAYALFES